MLYLTACDICLHFIGTTYSSKIWRDSPLTFEALKEFVLHYLPMKEVQLLKPKMVAWHCRN
jgi:hypothetical protein